MHTDRENSYHRRQARRLEKAREARTKQTEIKYIEVDRFLLFFEQAYLEYYQKQVRVAYKNGWYYFLNIKARHREIENFLWNILGKIQEEDSPNPDSTEDTP